MAIRPGIFAAILVIVAGLSRPGRPEAQSPIRLPRGAQDRMPAGPHPGGAARLETLADAWTIALAVDQRLEAQRWSLSAAGHFLESARARRLPLVDIEGSYTGRTAEPAFQFDLGAIPLPTNTFRFAQNEDVALRAKADLPLYTSGRIRSGIDAAAADVTSSRLEVEGFVNDLKLQVGVEYVNVLRAQRDLQVAESTVRSLESHTRDVERLFKQGQVPWNDVLAAQVALSNARQEAIQAYNRLDSARAAYNRRLNRPLGAAVQIAELPPESVREDVERLTACALHNRPELARYGSQIRALHCQSASLVARNRPQINLRGEYLFEENRFRTPNGIAAIGIGASWNAFDGGRNRHQAAALQQRAEGLIRTKRDLQSRIALQVRRAWLDIHETQRRLKVTSEAIQRAEENLRVAKKRYALGAAISTEVLDAEALRTRTYRNHYNATYDAVLATLRLHHATGRLKQ